MSSKAQAGKKTSFANNSGKREVIDRVFHLIMVILHGAFSGILDELLVIDLSILGSEEKTYNEFEALIWLGYK